MSQLILDQFSRSNCTESKCDLKASVPDSFQLNVRQERTSVTSVGFSTCDILILLILCRYKSQLALKSCLYVSAADV